VVYSLVGLVILLVASFFVIATSTQSHDLDELTVGTGLPILKLKDAANNGQYWQIEEDGINQLLIRYKSDSAITSNVIITPMGSMVLPGKINAGKTSEAWSVRNTNYLIGTHNDNSRNGNNWHDIPGLEKEFILERSALVHITAGGVQRFFKGNRCHVGYRLVVDNVARGNPTWGQQLQSFAPVNGMAHDGWNLIEFENLNTGTHTIKIQATNFNFQDQCIICGEAHSPPSVTAYDDCAMNIVAYYE